MYLKIAVNKFIFNIINVKSIMEIFLQNVDSVFVKYQNCIILNKLHCRKKSYKKDKSKIIKNIFINSMCTHDKIYFFITSEKVATYKKNSFITIKS